APFCLLEAHGFEVWLVNARDVKHLPGRPKTDKLDAVWLGKVGEREMLRPRLVPPPAAPRAPRRRRAGGRGAGPATAPAGGGGGPRRSSGWRRCGRTPRSSSRWSP